MGKFRIKKETLEKFFVEIINAGYPSIEDFAKAKGKSISYIGDVFAEIRRGLKRGDIVSSTTETMEFFLRTSKREARMLDSQKS